MQKKMRFGSATRNKACQCCKCDKQIPAGIERWFDNTAYPKAPLCTPCKIEIENAAPEIELADVLKAADKIFDHLRPKLLKLITDASDALLNPPAIKVSDEQLAAWRDRNLNQLNADHLGAVFPPVLAESLPEILSFELSKPTKYVVKQKKSRVNRNKVETDDRFI